jgi:aminopeptidase N
VAVAAIPDARVKAEYFTRYLRDTTLNEDWATASLGAFNELNQQQLTLPYLKPALDTLPWLQRNRRIFFIGSWLDGFLSGQTNPDALATVQRFLDSTTDLPIDLRRKVLQAEDELARAVAIRSAASASVPTPAR